MLRNSDAPILLRDVIDDVGSVIGLLERNAPYTPLGGWFRPGLDPDSPTSPMWFQNDWVHAELRVPGSELFLFHPRVTQAARDFYGAEIIEPQSVYVNLMAGIASSGPAHTDNPRFQGRDRSNTPMWLLRAMLWSGLFDSSAIVQATSIWWMNDVEGGGLLYWPEGPDKPPQEHVGAMANTALVGDNHGMFHQVGPVGPFDRGTILVTPRAELAKLSDGSGDWAVRDRGEIRFRAPLANYRVSVLWKADVYRDAAERKRQLAEPLSLEDVAQRFDRDLEQKRAGFRFDLARLSDGGQIAALKAVYPEPLPLGRRPSIYDAPGSRSAY
jgi:hypothetical protein